MKKKIYIISIITMLVIITSSVSFFLVPKEEGSVSLNKDNMISYTIDGNQAIEKPTKEGGYIARSIICENGTNVVWDNDKWEVELIKLESEDRCVVDFTKDKEASGYKVTGVSNIKGLESTSKTTIEGGTVILYPKNGYIIESVEGCNGVVENNKVKVTNVTSNQTCNVTFNFDTTLLADKILKDNDYTNATGRPNFRTTEISSKLWKASVTENNTTGTTYYFTGNPNNWVSFGGFLWRVIRINEDGSVRLLYAGSGGEDGSIGTSKYNLSSNHPGYVGYKYALGSTLSGIRGTTESTILNKLNTWYNTNLVKKNDGDNSYDSYISREAVYCNDRELASGSSFSTSKSFSYTTYERLVLNKTPTYNCKIEGDRFTGSNLTYPIGLMTADEISFAGGLYNTDNSLAYYYLNKTGGSANGDSYWWTMGPSAWSGSSASIFVASGSSSPGSLNHIDNSLPIDVRPVLSLKSCTKTTGGTGTGDDPYTVTIDEECMGMNN